MNTLGDRIKELRGDNSQIQFAARLGIPQTNLSRYERNTSVPDIGLLIKMADICAVHLDWLVAARGPMRPGDVTELSSREYFGNPSERVAKLETKLEKVEQQRDDLIAENRHLWKENGELREKVARLEGELNKRGINQMPLADVGGTG